jgi:hypothetical protein
MGSDMRGRFLEEVRMRKVAPVVMEGLARIAEKEVKELEEQSPSKKRTDQDEDDEAVRIFDHHADQVADAHWRLLRSLFSPAFFLAL